MISRVSIAGSNWRRIANSTPSCFRSASTADCMSAYCSLQASRSPSSERRAMHLAERRRGRGMVLEACEPFLPVGAKLGLHAALDEGPAHRRRLALQLGQFVDVFGRQRLGDGGEQLRHLHDRAFEAAERRRQLRGVPGAVEIEAEEARAGDPRRHAADVRADAGVARGAGCEAVSFLIGHRASERVPVPIDTRCPRIDKRRWAAPRRMPIKMFARACTMSGRRRRHWRARTPNGFDFN